MKSMETKTQDGKFETTSWISQQQKHQMKTHKNFSHSGIIGDATYEAWDDLADKHREEINWADDNLSWTPADRYLELQKHRVSQHKKKYVRRDMFGLTREDKEKLKEEGRYKDFKTAIKMWNGKQLTAQLQMTDAYEMGADST